VLPLFPHALGRQQWSTERRERFNGINVSIEFIVRKYFLRWVVEKEISEQLDFFA
jgi:hypothetical protein